jgi:SAM-dependent methyltransferase
MFGRTLYSTKFFAHLRESSGRSANALVPIVLELHPARSMIDVGCGTAGWVKAFADRGVAAAGIDGDYVRRDQLLIDHERFAAYDLNRQLDIAGLCRRFGRNERFDLATCLEVAEHLAPERSDGLVRDLCGLQRRFPFKAGPVTSTNAGKPGGRSGLSPMVTIRSTCCAGRSGVGAISRGGTSKTPSFTSGEGRLRTRGFRNAMA